MKQLDYKWEKWVKTKISDQLAFVTSMFEKNSKEGWTMVGIYEGPYEIAVYFQRESAATS